MVVYFNTATVGASALWFPDKVPISVSEKLTNTKELTILTIATEETRPALAWPGDSVVS